MGGCSYFSFLHTDVDSARYMLSALVQGEAAIVALVVTLSLIAVQLAASSYSARVIEVFRRTPDLWILMGIYGISIFYGLGVLKLITKADPELCATKYICFSTHEWHIKFSYYLGVYAFVALVPYMWNTLEMLKPSTVINMLAERIARENILDSIEGQEKPDDKDPIQPIIDIVCSSLMRADYGTIKEGLDVIYKNAFEILNTNSSNNLEAGSDKILNHIFFHFIRVARAAVNKDDEISLQELITNMGLIGKTAANKQLDKITIEIIESIKKIGDLSVKHKLRGASTETIESLANIGLEVAKQKNDDVAPKVVIIITLLGVAITDDIFNGKGFAAHYLRQIQKVAKENRLENTLKTIRYYTNEN